MPLSSYQRFPISFLTTILGKESLVSINGLSSASAFSSPDIVYADWIYVRFPPEFTTKSISLGVRTELPLSLTVLE